LDLIVDGFMGPKTQLVLARAVDSLKPKPKPKPAEPVEVTDDQLDYQLRIAEEWMTENGFPKSRPALICFLRKLGLKGIDDTYFEAEGIHRFFRQKLGSKSNAGLQDFSLSARRVLKTYMKTQRTRGLPIKPEGMIQKIQGLVEAVIAGVRATDISYCHDPRRPGVQRELKRLSTRSDSLYSCPGIKERIGDLKGCAG
ncbi:MAG TPA: hypothetical protein VH394_26405, partial [Thermoanaerobaculia bacterium]|nr:hypothetical protein [Thermoanaerobaculia bacterium]